METTKLNEVLATEKQVLTERRSRLFGEEAAAEFEKTKFGIALSGGGIRSATINLGFLRTLNLFKILERADYLSTVSGGGYIGAYVQANVKEEETEKGKGGYEDLFAEKKIEHLRNYGDYLIPGQGSRRKLWNTFLLTIGFVVSWVMSLLSPAAVIVAGYLIFNVVASLPFFDMQEGVKKDMNSLIWVIFKYSFWTLGGVAAAHFLLNLVFNFNLNFSKLFNKIESILAAIILALLILAGVTTFDSVGNWNEQQRGWALLIALGLVLAGYILNPNSLSFHRYYRKQLSDAFLSADNRFRNLLLKNVFRPDGGRSGYLAPYCLINTCLNLQNPGDDDKFKGAKASDYFLLSPLFCGSKLSCYVKTEEFPGFRHMTLPAALTISAAAVNPGMGIYSNKILSICMTLFNARLGFWVNNPMSEPRSFLPKWATYVVWWPSFFFKELFGKIGTDNRKLNISDGGHIENLAVYELLRRQCRLIMAVDAGADPASTFADLENLSIRARNELGIDIAFRPGEDPVDIIRPKASSGYAQKRFAIADLLKIWEEFPLMNESGKPVKFRRQVKEAGGKVIEKDVPLEALVNYFYSKTDAHFLKFRVDLKAERGIDLSEEAYDNYQKIACEMVRQKLEGKGDIPAREKIKTGTLVYIKSSVTSPRKFFVPEFDGKGRKNLQFDTFKYKIYHPDFPHESTADQFFDPVQWESYYQLGQYIAVDVLGAPGLPRDYQRGGIDFSIADLIRHFDNEKSLFDKEIMPEGMLDASTVGELEISGTRGISDGQVEEYAAPVQQTIAEEMQFKI